MPSLPAGRANGPEGGLNSKRLPFDAVGVYNFPVCHRLAATVLFGYASRAQGSQSLPFSATKFLPK